MEKRLWVEQSEDGTWQAHSSNGASLTFGSADGLFSPVDLMKIALAGCTAITSQIAIDRMNFTEGTTRVTVSGTYNPDEKAILNFSEEVVLDTHEPSISSEQLHELQDKAEDYIKRGCTVKHTYEQDTPVRISVHAK